MFGIAPSELMLVGLVALVFVGPKDLPRAMRLVGIWIGRGRSMSRHMRLTLDQLVQEAEGLGQKRNAETPATCSIPVLAEGATRQAKHEENDQQG